MQRVTPSKELPLEIAGPQHQKAASKATTTGKTTLKIKATNKVALRPPSGEGISRLEKSKNTIASKEKTYEHLQEKKTQLL